MGVLFSQGDSNNIYLKADHQSPYYINSSLLTRTDPRPTTQYPHYKHKNGNPTSRHLDDRACPAIYVGLWYVCHCRQQISRHTSSQYKGNLHGHLHAVHSASILGFLVRQDVSNGEHCRVNVVDRN